MKGREPLPIAERLWRRVVKTETCWLWQGSKKSGYGQMSNPFGKRPLLTHRVSWELVNGRTVPDGLSVLHHCDTPACVNPDHLYAGTDADNVRDMIARGRDRFGNFNPNYRNLAKTHCPQGHPYDEVNTRWYQGRRYCKECVRQRNAAVKLKPATCHPDRPLFARGLCRTCWRPLAKAHGAAT